MPSNIWAQTRYRSPWVFFYLYLAPHLTITLERWDQSVKGEIVNELLVFTGWQRRKSCTPSLRIHIFDCHLAKKLYTKSINNLKNICSALSGYWNSYSLLRPGMCNFPFNGLTRSIVIRYIYFGLQLFSYPSLELTVCQTTAFEILWVIRKD